MDNKTCLEKNDFYSSDTKCLQHTGLVARVEALHSELKEKEDKVNIQFKGINREISIAKIEMDRRLEAMNEFRAQLSSQAATFISRTELKLEVEKLEERVCGLDTNLTEKIEVLSNNVENKLTPLQRITSFAEGKSKWSDYIITVIVSAISAVIVSVVLFILLSGP